MKILLAADGSAYTGAAAAHVARMLADRAGPDEVHVFHVQPPLPYEGRARSALGNATVDRYEREEAQVALGVAEARLRNTRATLCYSWVEGDPVKCIAAYVREHGIELVVVGSRGHGAIEGALLGSVALACVRELPVPVLVVPKAAAALARARAA